MNIINIFKYSSKFWLEFDLAEFSSQVNTQLRLYEADRGNSCKYTQRAFYNSLMKSICLSQFTLSLVGSLFEKGFIILLPKKPKPNKNKKQTNKNHTLTNKQKSQQQKPNKQNPK